MTATETVKGIYQAKARVLPGLFIGPSTGPAYAQIKKYPQQGLPPSSYPINLHVPKAPVL
jgi:hypothetical protein